jgi:hypothetical protein
MFPPILSFLLQVFTIPRSLLLFLELLPEIVKVIPLQGMLFTVVFKMRDKKTRQFDNPYIPFFAGTVKRDRTFVNVHCVVG